jgi:transposase-like protein
MNIHKNAPLTPKGREAMVRSVVESGLSQAEAADQFNTTPKTVAKWVKRFRVEGVEGLRDRSSAPHLERFPAKWKPVRVKKTRQNKRLEPRSDSIGTEKALEARHQLASEG